MLMNTDVHEKLNIQIVGVGQKFIVKITSKNQKILYFDPDLDYHNFQIAGRWQWNLVNLLFL